MGIWFIADTHFGRQPRHRIKTTGLTGPELDELMISRWRECIGEGDTVWHLGDIGPDRHLLKDLPGTKYLIKGNDDPSLAAMRDSGLVVNAWKRHLLQLEDVALYLVHDPRDAPAAPGGVVVHGHTHELEPAPGQYSISVDRTQWAPVSLENLKWLIVDDANLVASEASSRT